MITSEFMRDVGALELPEPPRYTSGVVSNGASGVASEDVTGANMGRITPALAANNVFDRVYLPSFVICDGPRNVTGTVSVRF